MRTFFFIFVAFVGSATAFDGKLSTFAETFESSRRKLEARFTSFASTETTEEVTTSTVTACVKTEKELRVAVNKARTKGPKYTNIDLCTRVLKINNNGIDVSNKWIKIGCGLKRGRCTLDGQTRSGFFYGLNTNIKLDRISFVNGLSEAPIYFSNSNAQISRSSFYKNFGAMGVLVVENGAYLDLSNVTFEEHSKFPCPGEIVSICITSIGILLGSITISL
jgi:hypothetical protein